MHRILGPSGRRISGCIIHSHGPLSGLPHLRAFSTEAAHTIASTPITPQSTQSIPPPSDSIATNVESHLPDGFVERKPTPTTSNQKRTQHQSKDATSNKTVNNTRQQTPPTKTNPSKANSSAPQSRAQAQPANNSTATSSDSATANASPTDNAPTEGATPSTKPTESPERHRNNPRAQALFAAVGDASMVKLNRRRDPVYVRMKQEQDQKAIQQRAMEGLDDAKSGKMTNAQELIGVIKACANEAKPRVQDIVDIARTALKSKRGDQPMLETAIKACFYCKSIPAVKEIQKEANDNGIELGESIITTLQTSYAMQGDPDASYEIYKICQERGTPLGPKDNALLKSLLDKSDASYLEKAKEVLETMRSRTESKLPDDVTWTTVCNYCFSVANMKLFLELLDKYGTDEQKLGRDLPAHVWDRVIQNCTRLRDFDGSFEILKRMKSQGLSPSAVAYSSIVRALTYDRRFGKAVALYEEMKVAGLTPDEEGYHLVLRAATKGGYLDVSKTVLEELRGLGFRPQHSVYISLVEAYVRAGDFSKAFSCIQDMKKDGFKPSLEIWSLLIRGLNKASHFDRATSGIEALKAQHSLEYISYPALLRALTGLRRGEYSTVELANLKSIGIEFDENLRSALLLTMNNNDASAQLKAILAELQKAELKPDENIFNSLLDEFVRKHNLEAAREVLATMKKMGVDPSRVTMSIFIKGLGGAGCIDEACNVFRQSITDKTTYEYNTLLYQLVRNNRTDLVSKFFAELNTSGLEATEVTANILMLGFGRAKELDKCFNIFNSFKTTYKNLSAVSYNTLMHACLQNKQPERALRVLNEMKNQHVQPTVTYGWDIIEEAIPKIDNLEKGWSEWKHEQSASSFVECLKSSVECGRKDLVVSLHEQADIHGVNWSEAEAAIMQMPKGSDIVSKARRFIDEAYKLGTTIEASVSAPFTRQQMVQQ